ncbi:rpsU-divergently transcribed protein [Lichtheimia ornata]|uniref:Ubiquinone biosynthesis protein n=1 Tax=Lichtheimia ornata TaxID=688661 RepID=A0AAD7Y003_9FUNG|nr:rpsU-divergently transcribed protein [Lichtheimia ornata]KAJ8656572.1 rpsU-divergently transcribed protein [Lichtheimia ornata]
MLTRSILQRICIPTSRRCLSTIQSQPQASSDPASKLLKATLPFVPQFGWTMESIVRGARELGYPSVAHGVFVNGEAGLVDAFLKYCRQNHVAMVEKALTDDEELKTLNTPEKIKKITAMRLDLLKPYAHRWSEALAIMAYPSNIPMSVTHLAELADDVLFYAGDRSPDFNWYINRAGFAAIYTSTELFMTQDKSTDFFETARFLDSRLAQAAQLKDGKKELDTMLEFGAKSFLGLLGTRGIRV